MPTWDKVSPSITLKSLFISTPSVMHVHYLDELPWQFENSALRVSDIQLKALTNYIKDSFHKEPQILGEITYYGQDRFFKAKESYHLFNTCNNWTAKGLKLAGLRYPLWSPFKYGVVRASKKD